MFVDYCMIIGYIRSSYLCSLLCVEQFLIYEDVVQSLYDVLSLALTELHTNQL